ncbi:peroxide stress protein YaaA [Azospira restricta]|uniref:UPF0246 protein IWH25_10530 n=1 Tax=Azospira restricta TaxID=404405 RepID=A0A974PVE4_9RHOO|nr:peroxide stress protein YaaA [Azospira restricta]QRJ62233.1 peroxide stress protein YaaA [Azospira restricta]
MILVLSPAKRLDYETPPVTDRFTEPRLLDQSALLIERLRELSPAEIASLMSLSDPLAALNHARYADWQPPFTPANAKPAALAFAGDVYEGLDAATLPAKALDWLQAHARILSGLYGVLRPLDLMQPYRLEMGTRLANARGKDLYAFWGERISELLQADLAAAKAQVLVNLASEEYFKAVRPARLGVPVVQPVFEDWKGGRYKVVSFFAKRARGLMARYAAEHRLRDAAALQAFAVDGYAFAAEASDDARWVFRRRVA